MFPKIHSVAIVLIGSLFFMAADASAELEQAKSNIISLVKEGNYAQAQVQTQGLIADFSGNPALPETLYWIAEEYYWARRFEEANNLYQQIIKDHPDSSYASKAKLAIARAEATSLILSKNYDRAKDILDELVTDFSGHPDWPETLYWIAEEYHWARRFEDANNLYQQIIKDYPDSSFASKAKLGIARANVLSLIISKDYDRAKEAFDRLAVDFILDPDLPGTLYWIAEEYKWSERFEDAKSVYQKIIRSYPDSSFADKSRLGIARAEATSLVSSQNYDQAKEAIGKMISDFNDHPDLPGTLYWIADGYRWSGRHEEADNIYRLAIQEEPPESSYARNAKLGISSANVLSLIVSQDYNQADEAFDKMIADFSGHPDLAGAILVIGEQCYKQGLSKQDNDPNQAKDLYEMAVKVCDRLINELPDNTLVPEALRGAGLSYYMLGKPQKSITYFQKVVDDYPQYEFVWSAQSWLGDCYEKLRDTGADPKAEAKMEQAFKAVIEKYPDCPSVEHACLKLAELGFSRKRPVEAAMYLELFLQTSPDDPRVPKVLYDLGQAYEQMGEPNLAAEVYRIFIKTDPNNPLVKTVKARLEKLEGVNK
jgi:TolA-binding protein